MSRGPVRHIRLRAMVAYPAVALVAALALAITPFSSAQGMALAALPTPTDTLAATVVPTTADPTTADPTTADPTTAAPTSVPTTDAPTSVPTTAADPLPPTSAATTAPDPVPNPTPGVDPSSAPVLGAAPVDHHVLARIGDANFTATYLTVDEPVLDASQFQSFRVRFQLHNDGTDPVTLTPQLESRAVGAAAGFAVVPQSPQLGSPLHLAREWVPSAGGTMQGPLEEAIAVAGFKLPIQAGEAVVGHHSMGASPEAITLSAGSYTEQEFTVQLSMDAKYLTGYELQITDGGTALPGGQVARIVLGAQPELQLTGIQRTGVAVVDPQAANAAGAVYPLLAAPTAAPTTPPTTAADTTLATAIPAIKPAGAPLYALDAAAVTPVAVPIINPAADSTTDSHDIGSAQCGTCHRGHTAKAPDLTKASQQSTLCFSCHGSAGPGKDVKSQYALTRPVNVNDADARDYYSHDAVDTTTSTRHTLDVNEFAAAAVDNRHSECADCHNSHKAGTKDSTQTLEGWDASGRLAGVTGVEVTNSETAGVAPTYKILDGVTDQVTREYQLCFKCHSGYTTLLPKIAGKPSTDALDKGVELNPANPSFHPVEAKGTNQTDKMKASLAGTSPYKLWNFNTTSTVRCLNCHAGGGPGATAAAALPLPGSSLQPHTSSNRGILLENYLDRELKPRTDSATLTAAYSAGDFALCYVCHAEAPFANKSDPPGGSSNATNFKLHGLHLTGLAGKGDKGTDIDTAGDGQGNAICAECHFRTHSTTDKVGIQTSDDTRLVNFAPNVQPGSSGTISWTRAASPGTGSCTLTCHGYEHTAGPYSE